VKPNAPTVWGSMIANRGNQHRGRLRFCSSARSIFCLSQAGRHSGVETLNLRSESIEYSLTLRRNPERSKTFLFRESASSHSSLTFLLHSPERTTSTFLKLLLMASFTSRFTSTLSSSPPFNHHVSISPSSLSTPFPSNRKLGDPEDDDGYADKRSRTGENDEFHIM
jgi:hypothetical protein